jgi:nicotinate-nucleotide adenylyltransferase
MEISSSFIRKGIKNKKDMSFWMPDKVYEYILEMHFYEK